MPKESITPLMVERRPHEPGPIDKGRKSLPYFVAAYFSDLVVKLHLDLRPGGFHREVLEEMQEAVELGLKGWDQPTMHYGPLWRYLVSARELGKSACVRFLYCWLMSYPEKLVEAYVVNLSRDRDKAQLNLDYVKEMLANHDDWRQDFSFGDDPRSEFDVYNVFEIKTSDGMRSDGSWRKSFRLEVYGRDKMRGFHPGLMVCDDLEDLEDVQNSDTLAKYKDRFARELCPSISVMKPMIYIGTLLTENALLTMISRGVNVIKDQPLFGWRGKEWDLIKPDGSSLWPVVWPVERIEFTRRTMNAISEGAFEYEFMNDVRAFKNQVWPSSWWPEDSYPPEDLKLGYFNGDRWIAAAGATHYTAVDPAVSKKERSDYSACISASIIHTREHPLYGHAFLIDDWRAKLSPWDLMQRMHEQADRYPGIIGVEASQNGVFFEMLKHERSSRGVITRVVPLKPWGASAEDRARKGSFLVQMKRFHLAPHFSKQARLEFNKFPFCRPDHDDFASCLSYLQQMVSEHILTLPQWLPSKTLSRHAREVARLKHPSPKSDPFMPPIGRSNLP